MPLDTDPDWTPPAETKPPGHPRNTHIRRAEVYRVLIWRHETPATWTRAEVFALCVATARCGQPDGGTWLDLRKALPQFAAELPEMMARASRLTKTGRGMGLMIRLTEAESRECRAWRLQSIDGPTPEERRQKEGTEGRRERRACKGAVTRAEYLESQAGSERKAKPWEALRVGQATYYRYKAAGRLHELHARLLSVIADAPETNTNPTDRSHQLPPCGGAPAITDSTPCSGAPCAPTPRPECTPAVGRSLPGTPLPIHVLSPDHGAHRQAQRRQGGSHLLSPAHLVAA